MMVYDDNAFYDLEFRSTLDDAWYSVRVVLSDDNTLVVKFWNFSESTDESFGVGDFKTIEAVEEFVRRFRLPSQQLQDSQCSRLVEGIGVCASFTFSDDDIRFYDAVVEAVHHVEHSFAKEEEECFCTFLLFWQHGPNEGNVTASGIANLCLIQPFEQMDSRVVTFSKMAKEKVKIARPTPGSVSDGKTSLGKSATFDKEDRNLSTVQESTLSQCGLQEGVRQFGSLAHTKEGRINKFHERNHQDIDFGGGSYMREFGSHHFMLIENLEKDLSPSSIMEFIHKQTSISPQAYVFPSLSSETYTRGVIVLDCKKKLEKIYEFLNNPDQIVMSSRGRPWVITETISRRGTFRTTLGCLIPTSQNRSIDGELKVVRRGAKEFMIAQRLRDLLTEFVEHQQRLHKRLTLEEKKILQPAV
ncbi:hypothetical protein LOK49_LG07G02773 [Camellia lanceoleosa]|uniref:Uncharacterized protein n=1 Tax=Camellia lanceoleosa TaxID=1840588 RepID=A0ACC0H769_9ERIC|nr:hypothetical protein LOK49_LG07G02773 [Camellia lanceoleosa]